MDEQSQESAGVSSQSDLSESVYFLLSSTRDRIRQGNCNCILYLTFVANIQDCKCAQISMREDGTIAHACGAHRVQLPQKLVIFTELFNKKRSKRNLMTNKVGRQLSERDFETDYQSAVNQIFSKLLLAAFLRCNMSDT